MYNTHCINFVFVNVIEHNHTPHHVAIFVISGCKEMFHTEFVGTFMIQYITMKYQISSCSGSSVIAIRLKAKYGCHIFSMLCNFLQKERLAKITDFL
jgi:hypothetical protein